MIKSTVTMLYKFVDHSEEELKKFIDFLFPILDLDVARFDNESFHFFYSYDEKEIEIRVISQWKEEEFNSDWDTYSILEYDYDSAMITPRKIHDLVKAEGNLVRLISNVENTEWTK